MYTSRCAPSLQQGLTLIELMVTLAVLGILIAVVSPSFNDMLVRNRLASSTNQFHSLLKFARNEAISRKSTVTICGANAAQTACNGTPNNYSNGVLIMQGTSVLLVQEELPATLSTQSGTIEFDRDGLTTSNTFGIAKGDEDNCIEINISGQISTKDGACS